MSMDYTDKDTFLARWGDGSHVEQVIKRGVEPLMRVAIQRNINFDQDHHNQLLRDSRPYVRHLAAHSRFVTTEELGHMMKTEHEHPMALNAAMQHPRSRIEDVKEVAFTHPNAMAVGAAVRIVHTRKGGWTPEELHRIGNRQFLNKTGNDILPAHLQIPMHILNSTLPKDHPPITHNDIVKAHGGTLK